MMYGLTQLGIFHTLVSLVAVFTGLISLIAYRKISLDNVIGKTYVISTVIVCLTGFGIFQHGGFGKPHVLGIITLIVLVIAYLAGKKMMVFGKRSPAIETVCYSLTFFFHIVPGITETVTRLPLDAPLASSPEDPRIQMAIGVCFVLFIIGAVLQVRKLNAAANGK